MAFFHSPNIVTNGLVLALDAANPKSYPGSGNTWYDLSGNGNHATKNGNASNPVWNPAGYFTFAASDGSTGVNNIFTVANSATLQNLSNITVQFICAMETKTPVGSDYDWMCIVTKGEEGNQRPGTSVNQLPGNRYYHIETPSGVNSVGDLFTNADYTGAKYNMFQTRVSNAGGTQGWLNGTQVATSGTTTTGNTSTLFIGSNGFFELFKGKFASLYIYNRALTDAELLQNYNALKERYVYRYSEGNNAAPYVANWNNSTTYTMNQFGGLGKVNAHGWTTGPATYTLTLSSLPAHTEVRYKVFWHLVDSLDNETNQLFTMNSSGGETEKLRFIKQYNQEPGISVQDSGVIAPWSGHQTYTYRPWAGGGYGQDGYLSIDTGWYSHTANSFTARHVMGADQIQADEAQYLSHVQVYLR
jgi:hypothetical protein